jgi:signal peptidase I
MNPQADNTVDPLKRGLNPSTSNRPDGGQLNVPSRPGSLDDIDDSAFNIGEEKPQIVRVAPSAPTQPATPIILPAAPAPLPSPAPAIPVQAPQAQPPAPAPTVASSTTPASAAPQPVPLQFPAAAPAISSLPPVTQVATPPAPTVQSMPAPTAPPPSSAMPPSSPPPIPQSVPPQLASEQPKIPPMPVTPIEFTPEPTLINPPAPAAAQAPPATSATYQSATPHTSNDLIERIDETPQQNSRDIETLIEHNHRLHRLKSFASFLVFCAGVIIAAFLINQYIFQSYYVDGTSMTPTLQNDDRLIIDKVEHTIANLQGKSYIPQRGQVVVLDSSIVGFNGRQEQLIKRVIGLPGDTIIIKDGVVIVKNKQNPDGFDVTRQLGLNLQPTFVESPQEWTIDENHVFVMGDNRVENGSYDSRAFGPIEANKIVGRLWARILPFDKAQVF